MKEVIITISFIVAVAAVLIFTKKKSLPFVLAAIIGLWACSQEQTLEHIETAREIWQASSTDDFSNYNNITEVKEKLEKYKIQLTELVESNAITKNEAHLIEKLLTYRIAELNIFYNLSEEPVLTSHIYIPPLATRQLIPFDELYFPEVAIIEDSMALQIKQELLLLSDLDDDLINEALVTSVQDKIYTLMAFDYVQPLLYQAGSIDPDMTFDAVKEVLETRLEEIKRSSLELKSQLLKNGHLIDAALENLENEKERLSIVVWELIK